MLHMEEEVMMSTAHHPQVPVVFHKEPSDGVSSVASGVFPVPYLNDVASLVTTPPPSANEESESAAHGGDWINFSPSPATPVDHERNLQLDLSELPSAETARAIDERLKMIQALLEEPGRTQEQVGRTERTTGAAQEHVVQKLQDGTPSTNHLQALVEDDSSKEFLVEERLVINERLKMIHALLSSETGESSAGVSGRVGAGDALVLPGERTGTVEHEVEDAGTTTEAVEHEDHRLVLEDFGNMAHPPTPVELSGEAESGEDLCKEDLGRTQELELRCWAEEDHLEFLLAAAMAPRNLRRVEQNGEDSSLPSSVPAPAGAEPVLHTTDESNSADRAAGIEISGPTTIKILLCGHHQQEQLQVEAKRDTQEIQIQTDPPKLPTPPVPQRPVAVDCLCASTRCAGCLTCLALKGLGKICAKVCTPENCAAGCGCAFRGMGKLVRCTGGMCRCRGKEAPALQERPKTLCSCFGRLPTAQQQEPKRKALPFCPCFATRPAESYAAGRSARTPLLTSTATQHTAIKKNSATKYTQTEITCFDYLFRQLQSCTPLQIMFPTCLPPKPHKLPTPAETGFPASWCVSEVKVTPSEGDAAAGGMGSFLGGGSSSSGGVREKIAAGGRGRATNTPTCFAQTLLGLCQGGTKTKAVQTLAGERTSTKAAQTLI